MIPSNMDDMPHNRSHLLWEGNMENGSATPLFLKSMDGWINSMIFDEQGGGSCLLYTSPSPRDRQKSRMPSSA